MKLNYTKQIYQFTYFLPSSIFFYILTLSNACLPHYDMSGYASNFPQCQVQ